MKFLTIVISTIFTFILIEISTRVFLDNGMNYEIEMQKYATNLKTISKFSSVGIEHKKNKNIKLMGSQVTLDSNGFRNNLKLNQNKKKILLLGDSMTFGWGANFPFANVMQRTLKDYDIINAGIGNTNTIMQIENFFINFKNLYNYDIIVLNFFINDLEEVQIAKPNLIKKYSFFYTFASNTIKNFFIKNHINNNWIEYYKKTFENEKFLNSTLSKINELNNYCIKNNIKFYIHNIPELRDLKNYNFIKETQMIKNFADEKGIIFFNSYEILSKEKEESLWVTAYDSHANDKAHALIGKYLSDKILKFVN